MRRLFQAFLRYRPRYLTVALLAAIAALLMLSNISAEQSLPHHYTWYDWDGFGHKSYGWPLIWHRFVVCFPPQPCTLGWYCSYSRLAANVAIWLFLLVVPTGICEGLLRRHRPGLRWSLRVMLVAVALIALGLGWFVAARDRANVEDPLIADIQQIDTGTVWVERSGPEWLDLFGVDRFRRRIVGVSLERLFGEGPDDPEILNRVAHLQGLKHLQLSVRYILPELKMTDALNSLPRLRSLCVDCGGRGDWPLAAVGKMSQLEHLSLTHRVDADLCACLERLTNLKSLVLWTDKADEHVSRRFLATVGKLKKLAELHLENMNIPSESLACFAGLTNLQRLDICDSWARQSVDCGLLRSLPSLPQLETLDLQYRQLGDDDLAYLVCFPRLKSLSLVGTRVTAAGLSKLARLASLEDLSIGASPALLAELPAFKGLRRLHVGGLQSMADPEHRQTSFLLDDKTHLYVWATEQEAFRRALEALRQAKPDIWIDEQCLKLHETGPDLSRAEFRGLGDDSLPDRRSAWWPASEWPVPSTAIKAYFDDRGGWARFDAAGWGRNGTTTKF